MKVADEIEKYASEEDKPALRWLFERYHMESEWRIMAFCRFVRWGKASFQCSRIWFPTAAGNRAYQNAMLDALMKERYPGVTSTDGWVSAIKELLRQRDAPVVPVAPPEPDCWNCQDEGLVYRTGRDGHHAAETCEVCGRTGSPELIAQRNAKDEQRGTGVLAERCEHSPLEAAFRKAWLDKLRPSSGVNGGIDTLQLLMSPTLSSCSDRFARRLDIPEAEKATDRDYLVAATVIQWLGSNIGQAFLAEVRSKENVA